MRHFLGGLALAGSLALPALGQTVSIDVGSAAESVCTGTKYGAAQQPDMAKQQPPYNTLRYAQSLACDVVLPVGNCDIVLQYFENRPTVATPGLPASGPGTRVFSVTVNGGVPIQIDLFRTAGPQTPYALSLPSIPIVDGHLKVIEVANAGNASLSGIQAKCNATDPPVTVLHGTLKVDKLITGNPGEPTAWTVTQADGSTCTVTFNNKTMILSC